MPYWVVASARAIPRLACCAAAPPRPRSLKVATMPVTVPSRPSSGSAAVSARATAKPRLSSSSSAAAT